MDNISTQIRTVDHDDGMGRSCSDLTDLSSSNHSGFPPSSSIATSNTVSAKDDTFSIQFAVRHTPLDCSKDGALTMEAVFQLAWVLVLHQFCNHANEAVDVVEAYSTATEPPPDVSHTLSLPAAANFDETPLKFWKSLVSTL